MHLARNNHVAPVRHDDDALTGEMEQLHFDEPQRRPGEEPAVEEEVEDVEAKDEPDEGEITRKESMEYSQREEGYFSPSGQVTQSKLVVVITYTYQDRLNNVR